MSARIPCTCGRKRGDHSDLVCTAYRRNFSAFNGYHCTPSDYSAVRCTRPGCCGSFRTNAAWVETIPRE